MRVVGPVGEVIKPIAEVHNVHNRWPYDCSAIKPIEEVHESSWSLVRN